MSAEIHKFNKPASISIHSIDAQDKQACFLRIVGVVKTFPNNLSKLDGLI